MASPREHAPGEPGAAPPSGSPPFADRTEAGVLLGAAVRLGLVGSYEAQRLQAACGERMDETLDRCGSLDVDALAQTAPVLDLLHAGHDRLYSRLFQS